MHYAVRPLNLLERWQIEHRGEGGESIGETVNQKRMMKFFFYGG